MGAKEAVLAELLRQVPNMGRLSALRLTDGILKLAERFFPPVSALRPGQLQWPAIRCTEGPGRRIEQCTLLPVTLDLALAEPWAVVDWRQRRRQDVVALFEQARAQGALLTTEDVAVILCTCRQTVASYVQDYQRTSGTAVPTRATVHDIGPGVTHRLIISEKLSVQGRSVQQTANDTHHSVRAVTRYLKGFTRVRFCLEVGMSPEQTAQLTGMSAALVAKYQALIARLAERGSDASSLDTRQSGRVLS